MGFIMNEICNPPNNVSTIQWLRIQQRAVERNRNFYSRFISYTTQDFVEKFTVENSSCLCCFIVERF